MANFELNENICRICLDHNVIINWNEDMFEISGISYKDCYYKHTQLHENALDAFPTNLCRICANGLKNAHLIFEKALESFKLLQSALATHKPKISVDLIEIKPQLQFLEYNVSNEISKIDNPDDNKALINIEEEMYLPNMSDEETAAMKEYDILTNNVDNTVEPGHFIDIQNYEIPDVEQELIKNCRTKLKKVSSRKASSKKNKNNISGENLLKNTISSVSTTKLSEVLPEKKVRKKRNASESQAETQVEHEPKTNKKTRKVVKKCMLCSYCSFKCNGNTELKNHEATHNEDRKRTETCPQCGIKLFTKMALSKHIQIHDVNRQRDYKCEFCEKAFFYRGALNVHRRIHLGKMVSCPICSKEFYRQIDLDSHLPTHSLIPLQKNNKKQQLKYKVQCQYCNEEVPTKRWRGHKAAHLDQPQVKCKICDKNFFARSRCVEHIKRLHKKNKEYDQFIHYYVKYNHRVSHLILKQQEIVKPLTSVTDE